MTQQEVAHGRSGRKGATFAYFVVAMVVLCILVLLPFALTSIASDVADQTAPIFVLNSASPDEAIRSDVHVQMVALNEWDGTASLRVAVHQTCLDKCPWGDHIIFTSIYGDAEQTKDDRPASETVSLAANARDVTQTIKLPIFGDPIRYPFDKYKLGLGVIVRRVQEDGTIRTLTSEEAQRYVTLSIQGRVPRAVMSKPVTIDPAVLASTGDSDPFLTVQMLHFSRPLYMEVLTILLVLLVTAAAAYAVFLRPLNDLIIGSGALVLGVWGVRSILLGSGLPGLTAVDLSLSVVILFLLATITVRTAWLLEASSAFKPLRRRIKGKQSEAVAAVTSVDYVPDSQTPQTVAENGAGSGATNRQSGVATRTGS